VIRVDDEIALAPLVRANAQDYANLVAGESTHLAAFLPHLGEQATPEGLLAYLDRVEERVRRGEWIDLTVQVHGTIAGAIGLYDVDRERGRADVGYWLARKYAGRGIMTRALRALCAHAFAERGLSRIRLYSAVDNEASRALAERVGFRFVRILPRRLPSAHGVVDAALYVLRRDDAVGQS